MFFPIKSAFEYLHQLNRKESSQRDILGKPEIDDVIEQGLSRRMSHEIAIVNR